jgi:hypothetical protein
MEDPYLKVLQMIENGTLSAVEGEKLLDALEARPAQTSAAPPAGPAPQPATAPEPSRESPPPPGPPASWQTIWVYPFIGGFLLLAAAGILTDSLVRGGERLGWLACTIPMLLLGALVVGLAWWSRYARWLHLSVRGKHEHVRISLPLPLRLTAWVLRFARPWVPQLRDTAVDEVILALADVDAEEGMLSVEVDDEEEGEQVRVYIG